jgi:hypothetical protein
MPDVIQCESKHVAVRSDIVFETELCLTYVFFACCMNIIQNWMTRNKFTIQCVQLTVSDNIVKLSIPFCCIKCAKLELSGTE